MNAGEPDPEQLLWMDLPEWADEVPEDCVFYMLEELAIRHEIPLKPYDPNKKGKGRKVVLVKKSDLAKKKCDACGKEDDHFNFQCPNDPDRELMEQKVINGVEMVVYCDFCKTDDHSTWRCPDLESIPFGPMDEEDLVCEACGAEDEHWTDVCPKQLGGPPEPEPGFRECLICGKHDDSEHWTEDCPVLANGDRKFCWTCESVADHSTDDCRKFVQAAVIFCACCEATGDHWTEDCPREANDGRKYCEICDWLGDHSTNCCPLNRKP